MGDRAMMQPRALNQLQRNSLAMYTWVYTAGKTRASATQWRVCMC